MRGPSNPGSLRNLPIRQLIIYDLDGTLVDTRKDIVQAANQMLKEMGASPLSEQEIIPTVGRGLRHLVGGCVKSEDPGRIEQGMKIYRAYYAQHLLDYSRLYPGAREVLEHFKGRKQAVVTNKPNPYSRDILIGLGVADYFVEIIGGESEYPKKPAPEALISLMEKNRARPMETLFVGDSPIDIEAGRRAGVLTVVVSHGFAGTQEVAAAQPDLVVDSFKDFLKLAVAHGW